jgi:peptidoglycan hydrolase-like protein with peptidoglycan-binding domain
MKRIALLPLALLLLGGFALADDQLRDVQTELKSQGFFYGDANGQMNPETTAAIRRYQIRNGLEVTGTLNKESLAALGIGGKSRAPAQPPTPAPVEKKKVAPPPPPNLRKDESVEESDRSFLRREETKQRRADPSQPIAPSPPSVPRDPSVVDPPAPLDAPGTDYPVLFSGTPYANAPVEMQQQTLRRAQSLLASRGFYRDIVDGLPGPATEEALLTFQRAARLTMTGRLDLETLSELRLLPNSSSALGSTGFRSPQRVFRGIWIDRR